jgi:hypothetical protein
VLRKSNVTKVAFYFFGVVDGGADLQVAATFGTGANVNFKYSLEEFSSAVTLHFIFIDADRIKAFARLGTQDNEIAPLAVGRKDARIKLLMGSMKFVEKIGHSAQFFHENPHPFP